MENQNHKWLVITICSGVIIAFLTLLFSLANKQADKTVNVDMSSQQPVSETPQAVAEADYEDFEATANNAYAKEEVKPSPVKEDNYLAVASPEDMKKDAIRDVNKLFDNLANVSDSSSVAAYAYHDGTRLAYENYNVMVAMLTDRSVRADVKNIKQNELNIPASRISNKDITLKILNDIRFSVRTMKLNDNKWIFVRFDDNDLILKHNLPSDCASIGLADIHTIPLQNAAEYLEYNPGKILIYDSVKRLVKDAIYIKGKYSPETHNWQFPINDFFSNHRIVLKNKNTLYFEGWDVLYWRDEHIDSNDLYKD